MLRQVQTLAGAVMGSLVMIAIAFGIAFTEGERFDGPALWLVAAQVLAAISPVLMAVHAWPGAGPIEKTRASLEREGGRSFLREQLGLAPVGPIQEL